MRGQFDLVLAGLYVLIAFGLAFMPLLLIWSLNTLFPNLDIAYTFRTWLAALTLVALVAGRIGGGE